MSERPEAGRPSGASVIWAGIWFALLAGFVEAAVLLTRHFNDRFIHRSREFLWMTPTGYLLLFALPLVVIWLLYQSGRISFQLSVFFLGAGAATSVLLVLLGGKLHPAAILLLGIGTGLQIGRLAQRSAPSFSRHVSRAAPLFLLLVVLVGVGTWGLRSWQARTALSQLPAARAGAPNIVLIILDTVRAASLSLYGYAGETSPELERWARRGVVFDKAIATAPWTLPSHASLFTGHMPPDHSADWLTPLDDRWLTLGEALQREGYRTGGFVANLIYATWEHGLDRGFNHYEDYPFSLGMLLRHTVPGRKLTDARRLRQVLKNDEVIGRKSASRIGRDFLSWVDRDSARPFFAFLNYYDAHDPYLPPQDYFRKFAGHYRENRLSPLRRGGPFIRKDRLTASEIEHERASYDGAIAYLDSELSALFTQLEQRNILAQTLVIVTSDHGEEFGEHGVFFHGHTLYRQALHVPLMMVGPGVVEGRRVTQTVSLRDIPATIASLLNLPVTFPGSSLSRYWSDTLATESPVFSYTSQGIRIPDWFPAAHGNLASVIRDSLHYIQGRDSQMFHWGRDPLEQNNLAVHDEARPIVEQLRAILGQEQPGE